MSVETEPWKDEETAQTASVCAPVDHDQTWDLVVRAERPLFDVRLRELWDYRDLVAMLVKRDVVTLYKQTALGPIWYVLQPILTTAMYVLVFANIANISTDGIPAPLFYLSGIVLWNYFSESLTKISTTFSANAEVFGKVYFPRLAVPLSVIVAGSIKMGIQFGLFLVAWTFAIFTTDSLSPNVWILATPYAAAIAAMTALGLGLIFSSLTSKYRDLVFLIQFGVQLAMYATPIIYPMSAVGGRIRAVLWCNPMSHVVESFRYGFLGAGEASMAGLAYSTIFSLVVLAIGVVLFQRTERTFIDTV